MFDRTEEEVEEAFGEDIYHDSTEFFIDNPEQIQRLSGEVKERLIQDIEERKGSELDRDTLTDDC